MLYFLSSMETVNILRNLYLTGVHAVQPQNLMPKWLIRQGEKLIISEREYPLKDTYIIGFGKAVAGMVPHIENTLKSPEKSFIKKGILSVPVGYLKSAAIHDLVITTHPRIKLFEGAKSNLPDIAAQRTTEKITQLLSTLSEHDLLFVLISGGGSALLPLPLEPLSLEEKTQIIRALSLAGSSISEINIVRRAISGTKGGKLAKGTKAEIVSFILSDSMDNSLDVIASGPTVPNTDALDAPLQVLQKYNIPLTDNLKQVLRSRERETSLQHFHNVNNILIGDNNTALKSIYDSIITQKELRCTPIILTSRLEGEAAVVGKVIAQLAFAILAFLCGKKSIFRLESFLEKLCISPSVIRETESSIRKMAEDDSFSSHALCLLFGGETTVKVKGKGTGGRNQEMVLSASLEIERISKVKDVNGEIVFLSGGTDGIDGTTDAAGAITFFVRSQRERRLQTHESRQQGLSPEAFLQDNNSFEYFSKLSNGTYLLKPGHTGTNVMDIQLLFIKKFM